MKYFLAFVLLLLPLASVAQDTQFKQGPNESDHDWHCRQLLFMLSSNENSPEGRQVFVDTYKADGCGIYAKQPQPSVDDKTSLDGVFWAKLSEPSKDIFVQEFRNGYEIGFLMGYVKGGTRLEDLILAAEKALPPEKQNALSDGALKEAADDFEKTDVEDKKIFPQFAPLAVIVKRVNDFYLDPANAPVCMITAIQEVMGPSLPVFTEQQRLAATRAEVEAAAKNGCSFN